MDKILLAVLAIAAVLGLALWLIYRKRLNDLSRELEFAIEKATPIPVDMVGGQIPQKIITEANKLIKLVGNAREVESSSEELKKEHERLNEAVGNYKTRMEQTGLLTELGKQITGSLTIDKIFENFSSIINSLFEFSTIEMGILDEKTGKLLFRYRDNEGAKKDWIERPESELARWVMDNKEIVQLEDSRKFYSRYVKNPIYGPDGHEPGSVLSLPIVFQNKTLGVATLYSNVPEAFSEFHLNVMQSMVSYAAVAIENATFYEQLDNKNKEIEEQKKRSDDLLLNILPQETAEELKRTGRSLARYYPSVSVLFTDFVGFTTVSEKMEPEELVALIDKCFRAFDNIIERYRLEKIKTIGDAYMAAAGIPVAMDDHALKMVKAAIEIRDFMEIERQLAAAEGRPGFEIRIGINSGPLVAGVVGLRKFQYDIWGDTVNTAARMEQNSEPGKINVTGSTYELIKHQYNCTYRGKIKAKNKGEIDMYFVEGPKQS